MMWPMQPPDGASNLEHALAYYEAGLWVLPGRDPLDVRQYREGLLKQYLREGLSDAHEKAQRKAERCAKHSFVQWRKLIERPSREQIEAWFTDRPLRPVILLTGPGHGVCVVDVDTVKEGDPLPWVGKFDLHEETPGLLFAKGCTSPVRCDDLTWFCATVLGLHEVFPDETPDDVATHLFAHRTLHTLQGSIHLSLVGCLARTPSGGWHAYHLEAAVGSSEGSDGPDGRKAGVAHGVDIRGDGGLVVAPSGEQATPGRRWERWGAPSPFPLDEVNRRLTERQGVRSERTGADGGVPARVSGATPLGAAADREFVPDGPPDASRSFSHALLTTASDGQKNPRAKLIVGMLARSAPLPADARDAVLATLGEWCDGHLRLRGEPAATVRGAYEREARAPDRSPAFCLEVLKAWNALRCKPRWPEDKVEDSAASLWRSARTAEAAKVVPVAEVDPEDVVAKAEAEVDKFLRPLTGLYGASDLGRDLRRELLSCARLPLWLGPDGEPDRSAESEHGHGLGDEFDEVLGGGLSPKMLIGLGAESAKSCKSMLVEQVIDGHCLRSAMVLSGALTGPVVVSYCLSEMSATSQSQRQLARWLGVDSNVFRRGVKGACTAPGLRRLAERLGREPASLAAEFLARADAHLRDGLLARARDLRVVVDQRALEPDDRSRGGRPRNHRRGVLLLQALAEAVRIDRARKAKLWGRSEDQILPLIFVDPIQRYQREGDGDGVGALDELVEEMRAVADEDELVMLFTSDTQKASAQGQHYKQKDLTPYQLAAHVFRGSYKLMHLPDLALVLKVDWPDSPGMPATASLTAALNRWGMPRAAPLEFDLYPECGRYVPRRLIPMDIDPEPQQVEQDEPVAEPVRRRGQFAPKKRETT